MKIRIGNMTLLGAVMAMGSSVLLSGVYAQNYEPPRTVYGKPDLQGTVYLILIGQLSKLSPRFPAK